MIQDSRAASQPIGKLPSFFSSLVFCQISELKQFGEASTKRDSHHRRNHEDIPLFTATQGACGPFCLQARSTFLGDNVLVAVLNSSFSLLTLDFVPPLCWARPVVWSTLCQQIQIVLPGCFLTQFAARLHKEVGWWSSGGLRD